jgi:predicted amidohydrolase
VAAIQSEVINDKKLVLNKIKKQIESDSKLNANIACLPERWNIYKGDIKDDLEELDDFSNNAISSFANEFNMYIIAGAIWVKSNNNIIITSSLFNPEGNRIGLQQKQHLYSFEREFFEPAKELKLFDTEFGKIGI